jgi:hypothetical protein
MEKEKNPLKDTTVFLMIFTALLFDAIQALIGWIPFSGDILSSFFSIFAFLTFFLWFKMHGIKMMTPKRLASLAGGTFVELVPYLNLLPAWTGVVVYLIGSTKIKEMTAKHPTLAKGAIAAGGKIQQMKTDGMKKRNDKALGELETNLEKQKMNKTGSTQNTTEKPRFNLERSPEQKEQRERTRKVGLSNQPIEPGMDFNQLNRTGDRVNVDGQNRVVSQARYNLSNDTDLHIRGTSYTYTNKTNRNNTINAEYDKKRGELIKMHFQSENPHFAGRAIMDMIERIPPGSPVLGGETSMSTDSFPLLLKTVSKYESKTPGRFSVSQVGEFPLNDQGKFSDISKTADEEGRVGKINTLIDDFNNQTGQQIRHARLEVVDGKKQVVVPKIKVVKNY